MQLQASKQTSLGVTRFKNKVLKRLVNHQMIRLAPKPRNMYDNKKQRHADK
jgi:hypothetical protein